MQLTIFEDRVTPTNVFESYTFSFKYSGDEKNDSRRLTGLELQDSSGNPITVRTIKYGLQTMCRKLVELCTHLPELPGMIFRP